MSIITNKIVVGFKLTFFDVLPAVRPQKTPLRVDRTCLRQGDTFVALLHIGLDEKIKNQL